MTQDKYEEYQNQINELITERNKSPSWFKELFNREIIELNKLQMRIKKGEINGTINV